MNKELEAEWQRRLKLRAEGSRLRAEGRKLYAEGDKLNAEGNKLYAEGDKLNAEGFKLHAEGRRLRAEGRRLRAEGDISWAELILKTHGNITLEWRWNKRGGYDCHLGNGEVYRFVSRKGEESAPTKLCDEVARCVCGEKCEIRSDEINNVKLYFVVCTNCVYTTSSHLSKQDAVDWHNGIHGTDKKEACVNDPNWIGLDEVHEKTNHAARRIRLAWMRGQATDYWCVKYRHNSTLDEWSHPEGRDCSCSGTLEDYRIRRDILDELLLAT